ncbi:MAG TPA: hypothetical protein VJP77_08330 [Planctomycetota bacterium]|nr:hypothetical protein [Planctomycetota bacterium]
MRSGVAWVAVVLLAGLAACMQSGRNLGKVEPEPSWQVVEVAAPSERILWEMTRLALIKLGYPVGTGFDPTAIVASSGWHNELSPFSGEGYRIQAQLRAEPSAAGRWRLEARVRKQVNTSLVKPTDLSYADWSWVPDDDDRARLILQQVRASLGTELDVQDARRPQFGSGGGGGGGR